MRKKIRSYGSVLEWNDYTARRRFGRVDPVPANPPREAAIESGAWTFIFIRKQGSKDSPVIRAVTKRLFRSGFVAAILHISYDFGPCDKSNPSFRYNSIARPRRREYARAMSRSNPGGMFGFGPAGGCGTEG